MNIVEGEGWEACVILGGCGCEDCDPAKTGES